MFFVDWSELARAPCYPSAAHNTKYAGECIGQLVNRIHDAGSGGENIHLIGFSLGAHVAAFAANHAKNFKVRRITGTYTCNHIFSILVAKNHAQTAHTLFNLLIHAIWESYKHMIECTYIMKLKKIFYNSIGSCTAVIYKCCTGR